MSGVFVQFRLTEAERDEIRKAAEHDKRTTSAWIRFILLNAARNNVVLSEVGAPRYGVPSRPPRPPREGMYWHRAPNSDGPWQESLIPGPELVGLPLAVPATPAPPVPQLVVDPEAQAEMEALEQQRLTAEEEAELARLEDEQMEQFERDNPGG